MQNTVGNLARLSWFLFHLIIVFGLVMGLVLQYGGLPASAALSPCSATLSPNSATPSSDTSAVFGIYNPSDTPINWIKITSPGSQYATVVSASAYQWQADITGQDATYSNGSMDPGSSRNFSVEFTAGENVTTSPGNWTVQVSDNSNGSNPLSCDGDLSMQIFVPPSVITISNIQASNLTSNGIDISWDTDLLSTSRVSYGPDSSYGTNSAIDNSLVTRHIVSLKGLKPNTGYHYQVSSTTPADGGSSASDDNTFLTPINIPVASQTIKPPLNLVVTNPGDKTPPLVSLITKLPHVVQYIPTIQGTATDDLAVIRVEYSTDNGHNWLPADSAPDIGGKTVNFAFTPSNLDDGNYLIMVRAIDAGGNIATTTAVGVVIDRLPPLVGGSVVSLGPQILTNTNGNIVTQAGVDEKLTLSAVGGPTSINLTTKGQNKAALPQTFGLSQSLDSGLWSGIISFKKAGTYTLMANSIDGAGNKTTKQISKVSAVPAGQITDDKTKKPLSGQLTMYTMQPDSSNWIVWDGSPYSQANPQPVSQDGQFSFLLPAGKYYLSASAAKHLNFISDIFELTQPSPLSTIISLKPGHNSKLISWLNWSSQAIHLNTQTGSKDGNANKLIGNLVPGFSLKDLNNQTIHAVDLLGKPTDLVFLNTWAPTTSEQLPALNSLGGNKDINIKPVAAQENTARLSAYNEISGYNLNWLADPDSTTTQSFATPSLPTHYFVDRNGTVKHVVSGVLSNKQILSKLAGL